MEDHLKENQNISWINIIDPQVFFYEAIKKAQAKQSIRLPENIEFYLIQLLSSFIRANEHNSLDECLAMILKKSLESSLNERIGLYKKIADTSLYVCGFFQNYFVNKSFDIKYYISMGVSSYEALSKLMAGHSAYKNNTMAKIYHDMSVFFLDSIDILLCIADIEIAATKTRSTLSIYDSWVDTKSQKLFQDLLERDIIPLPKISKQFQ